jgi:hypothetical protein
MQEYVINPKLLQTTDHKCMIHWTSIISNPTSLFPASPRHHALLFPKFLSFGVHPALPSVHHGEDIIRLHHAGIQRLHQGQRGIRARLARLLEDGIRLGCIHSNGPVNIGIAQQDALLEHNGAEASIPGGVDRRRALLDAEHDPHLSEEIGRGDAVALGGAGLDVVQEGCGVLLHDLAAGDFDTAEVAQDCVWVDVAFEAAVGVDDYRPRLEREEEDADFVNGPLDELGDSSMKCDNYLGVAGLKGVELPDDVAVVDPGGYQLQERRIELQIDRTEFWRLGLSFDGERFLVQDINDVLRRGRNFFFSTGRHRFSLGAGSAYNLRHYTSCKLDLDWHTGGVACIDDDHILDIWEEGQVEGLREVICRRLPSQGAGPGLESEFQTTNPWNPFKLITICCFHYGTFGRQSQGLGIDIVYSCQLRCWNNSKETHGDCFRDLWLNDANENVPQGSIREVSNVGC